MTEAAPEDPEFDDLLPDNLKPGVKPLVRTPKQIKAAAKAAEAAALQAQSMRLAQIVNLHIAGHSLAAIGASIGATADEVDRMLSQETARYVRNQPQLRTYVRNWVSGKFTEMIDADWEKAVDKNSSARLENQDRVMRMLTQIARLHGAEAPTQTEVKVEAAPEAVERLVQALAAGQGLGYDTDIFDIPEEDVHEAVVQSSAALEVSRNRVEEGNDEF